MTKIIDQVKEIMNNFPEKLNTTHKEIINLVENYEWRTEWESENKTYNEILKVKYKEIEPLIEEVEKSSEVLRKAHYELHRFIDGLFSEKISEEWKKNYQR